MYDMKRTVEAGVQLLKEQNPDWQSHANPETLDMAYHGLCLLSQLYGSFDAGVDELDLGSPFGEEVQDSDGWEYGFTLPPWTDATTLSADYAQLTETWRNVIMHLD